MVSYLNKMLRVVFALLLAASIAPLYASEPRGALIDTEYEAVEAANIKLVLDNSGAIVGVRTDGCKRCPSSTLLPADGIVVEVFGRQLSGTEVSTLGGSPGVVHIYWPTQMVHRVVLFPEQSQGDE